MYSTNKKKQILNNDVCAKITRCCQINAKLFYWQIKNRPFAKTCQTAELIFLQQSFFKMPEENANFSLFGILKCHLAVATLLMQQCNLPVN